MGKRVRALKEYSLDIPKHWAPGQSQEASMQISNESYWTTSLVTAPGNGQCLTQHLSLQGLGQGPWLSHKAKETSEDTSGYWCWYSSYAHPLCFSCSISLARLMQSQLGSAVRRRPGPAVCSQWWFQGNHPFGEVGDDSALLVTLHSQEEDET